MAKAKGKLVNIEVQRETFEDMIDRSFFHAYALTRGSFMVAEGYRLLPRLTMIKWLLMVKDGCGGSSYTSINNRKFL